MTDQEFAARARRLCQTPVSDPAPMADLGTVGVELVAELAEANCPRDNEYLDEETGLLRCLVCGGPRQVLIDPPFPDRPPRKVRCRCSCLTEAELREQAQQQDLERQRRERRRAECFSRKDAEGNLLEVSRMIEWTFANDNGKRPEMSIARKYAELFPQYLEGGNGLLFYGDRKSVV